MPSWTERLGILAAMVATPLAILAASLAYRHWITMNADTPPFVPRPPVTKPLDPADQVLRHWQKPAPELVIALSGQMHGYLQPCGCARPQVGGLERRFELVWRLQQAGWSIIGFDLGDLVRLRQEVKQGVPALPEQTRLKYEIAWKMLNKMGWQTIGIGPEELLFPLEELFGYALNSPRPPVLLCTNLDWPEMHELSAYQRFVICEVTVSEQNAQNSLAPKSGPTLLPLSEEPGIQVKPTPRRAWRIACLSVIQESELNKVRGHFPNPPEWLRRFLSVETALANIKASVQKKRPDLVVMLHHGSLEEARQLAQKLDWISIVLSRDEADVASSIAESLPETASRAGGIRVQNRLLVRVGHKGKAIGLVAARPVISASPFPFVEPNTYRLDYRMVELTETLEPPNEKTNPVRELMKEYVYEVYARKFLEQWVTHRQVSHPQQLDQPAASFAGAHACAECHRSACQVWNNSKHSQAYLALVKYGQPQTSLQRDGRTLVIGRQYDPECVICHTTGFEYKTGFRSESETPHLLGNGCENCHGPASLHVQFPKEAKYWQPLKRTAAAVTNACRSCHDSENDPHFDFAKYWPKIAHKKD